MIKYRTAEEYRMRMIQAFKNADCEGLITLVVQPTEKEFEYLEWLLKNAVLKRSKSHRLKKPL